METLRKRLRQYQDEQLPIIARYEEQGKVITINGLQEVEAVYEEVKAGISANLWEYRN